MNMLFEQLSQLQKELQSATWSAGDKDAALAQLDCALQQAAAIEQAQNDAEHEAQASIARYNFLQASLDALPNPIFIKNEEGAFVYFNLAYQQYFQMDREQYLNKTVLDLAFLAPDERVRYQKEDLHLIETGDIKHYEMRFDLPDGSIGDSLYWSKGFAVPHASEKGLVGEIVDISEQKRLKNQIQENAEALAAANTRIQKLVKQDCLTGLYNRRAMDELVHNIKTIFQSKQTHITILMADLDHFKKVNDTFGHSQGDQVLMVFSQILLDCTRTEDLVVRFGGEEFLVILFDTPTSGARVVAERIRSTTEQKLILPNGTCTTVSIGMSELRENEEFNACLKRADEALYEAKTNGRNRVV